MHELEAAIPRTSEKDSSRARRSVIRIVRGPAGIGKSTLLEFLYNNHIERLSHGGAAAPPAGLPVFIDLQRDSAVLSGFSESDPEVTDVIKVTELLTGCAKSSIWQLDGNGSQRNVARDSVLAALFAQFQVFLYVDGYDQLSPSEAHNLKSFGLALRKAGCEVAYLLLSSRPGHDELRAFDWENTFLNATPPDPASLLSLATPDLEDVERYCSQWFDELKPILTKAGVSSERVDNLNGKTFFTWVDAPVQERASDANVDAIRKNPLLLAMALALYMKRFASTTAEEGVVIHTQADLLEELIVTLSESDRDHPDNKREKDDLHGGAQFKKSNWRARFEAACFESLRRLGRTTGRIDTVLLCEHFNTPTEESGKLAAEMRTLPFIHDKHPYLAGDKQIEFLHPAFHEYFAACYLYGKIKDSIGSNSKPAQNLIMLRNDRGVMISPAETIVNLGRVAFKYILGRLLRDNRRCASISFPPRPGALDTFFEFPDRDYGIQQYLYDAGFVDRSFDELRLIEQRLLVGTRGYRCVAKLIGHKYYGSRDELETGIAYMFQIANTVAQQEDDPLNRWYGLFCVDHIENRLLRVNVQNVEDKIRKRRSVYTTMSDPPPDLRQWVNDTWRMLRKNLGIFAPIKPTADTDPLSMVNVPCPVWDEEQWYVLRAAHYWGHVGNRVLIEQARALTEDLCNKRTTALQAYSRAVVYRLVSLFLSLGHCFERELSTALGESVVFPHWFSEWSKGDASVETRFNGVHTNGLAAFERFVGPAQAIADTANQFSCRADVLLWNTAHGRSEGMRETALDAAIIEKNIANRLWDLAKSERIRGFQGEQMVRYFLHLAGVEERIDLAQTTMRGEQLPSAEIVKQQAATRFERLEREYGMSYELAWQDVRDSTEAYRQKLAGLV